MVKTMDLGLPNFEDVKIAKQRISGLVKKTPVMSSSFINSLAGCEIFFKCENFQKVGAFKYRGATNAVLALSDDEAKNGVATHSSGNHAQALALAAKMRGIKAYIVMPNNSPLVKKEAVAGYGAEIIFCEPTLAARESTLNDVVDRTSAAFIHPYNNFNVICGQASAAYELIEEIENLDIITCPVGGGGLLSGTCLSTKGLLADAKVIAAEPEAADDAKRSLEFGKIIPSINPNTICDGLLTSLGELNFRIISSKCDGILTANDDEIRSAMKLIWERMKIIVEPSSAVTLAVILKNPEIYNTKRVGMILSGGNVDLTKIYW